MNLSLDDKQVLKGFDSFELKLGDELRGERATLGKSLLDVQRDLRVKASYISAIENCDISVFPNPGFVAGYVRSYARYLKLDPEVTFARFCEEARFAGTNPELKRGTPAANKVAVAPSVVKSAGENWVARMPGFHSPETSVSPNLAAFGPLFVLIAVVAGLGYGGWSVLQDIQRVEFAPIEQAPVVAETPNELGGNSALNGFEPANQVVLAADASSLYEKIELDIPLVEPRDGPIFAINTENPMTETAELLTVADVLVPEVTLRDGPVVSQTPHVPDLTVVAMQEAWVRIYRADGTTVFEKIMAAGEQYELAQDSEGLLIRAGNATSVFLMVDDVAYGPLSGDRAVVKNIPIQPDQLVASFQPVDGLQGALKLAAENWRKTNTASLEQ